MIRSGSKLLKKGGSVRNINKVGSKFRVALEFENVTKILGTTDVVLTWERKGVVLCTEPVKVDARTRAADFSGQKLTQIVTLFKSKRGGDGFEEKVYNVCLKVNNDKGKIIGKISLNFADYAAVPEYSKRMVAQLSHQGEMIMKVTSTFIGEAKKKKSSQGSSSVSSSTLGTSRSRKFSRKKSADPVDNDQSDLTDLDVPDFDDAEPSSSHLRGNSNLVPSQSKSRRDREREHRSRPSATSTVSKSSAATTVAASPSRRRERERRERESDSRRQSVIMPSVNLVEETATSDYNRSLRGTKDTTSSYSSTTANGYGSVSGGSGSRATVPRDDYEKLKRENRALVRKNNDLQAQNDELEDKLTTAGLNSNAGKVEVLEDELDRLRKEIRDLKSRLSREPVYADVVRELKDAKMGLAILSTENAELKSKFR